jgi:hypothetical protein
MSFEGTWNITLETPMGPQMGQLDLKTSGSVITGFVTTPMGQVDIEDGQIDGLTAKWKIKVTTPMKLTLKFVATVEDDNIHGKAKAGVMPGGAFSGTRVVAGA